MREITHGVGVFFFFFIRDRYAGAPLPYWICAVRIRGAQRQRTPRRLTADYSLQERDPLGEIRGACFEKSTASCGAASGFTHTIRLQFRIPAGKEIRPCRETSGRGAPYS